MTRSKGTAQQVLVEYRLLYLSPGITDPIQGVGGVAGPSTNTVQLPAGNSSVDVTLTLFSNGFMEENALLYVEITDAELSGGGKKYKWRYLHVYIVWERC